MKSCRMEVPISYKFSYFDRYYCCVNWLWNSYFFPWKYHEKILCPDEFSRMCFKLADELKLRPREWSILRYLLSQFLNGHLFEAFYKRISLCLLKQQLTDLTYPPLPIDVHSVTNTIIKEIKLSMVFLAVTFLRVGS